jgi:CBS domain containing-hemolysin-like protein
MLMAVCGILFQFVPHEVLNIFNVDSNGIMSLFVQLMGAMYLGFAMMNWMAKAVLVGGIYARPLAMGNFIHFIIGALALLKFAFSAPNLIGIWLAAAIYSIFAILFGLVMFTHPNKAKVSN